MLNDLLDIYPNYAMALVERGKILNQKEMTTEAKADIDKAITLMPNNSMFQQTKNTLATK